MSGDPELLVRQVSCSRAGRSGAGRSEEEVSEEGSSAWSSGRRGWGACLCAFALATAITSALIGELLPASRSPWTQAKLDHLREHSEDYDLIFLGSSQIYRHAVPELFEQRLADQGLTIQAFNLGVPNLKGIEARVVLRQVLAMRSQRLRWIVFDVPATGQWLEPGNERTERAASWHDARSTFLATRLIWAAEASAGDRLEASIRHAVAFFYRCFRVGQLNRWLRERAADGTPASRWQPGGLGARADGWVSMDQAVRFAREGESLPLLDRRNVYRRRVARALFERPEPCAPRRLRRHDGKERQAQRLTSPERALLQELVEMARAAGVEPIFVTSPDPLRREGFLKAARREGVIGTLFDLDQPWRYPELADPMLFHDWGHLTERGARLFTDRLAQRFSEHVQPTVAVAEPPCTPQTPGYERTTPSRGQSARVARSNPPSL